MKLTETLTLDLKKYYPEFSDYYPDCEPFLKYWCHRNIKKDWVIFDCGANIGYYTLLFSHYAGRVYAFEPTTTFDMLKENVQAYDWTSNVSCHKVALGASTQASKEEMIWRIWGHHLEKTICDFTTIDDFVKTNGVTKLDFIKIDVDGFDYDVLLGMETTMKTLMPIVSIEANRKALGMRNQTPESIIKLMAARNYIIGYYFNPEDNLICYPLGPA